MKRTYARRTVPQYTAALVIALVLLVFGVQPARTQETSAAPVLTDLQKLQVENALLRWQLAQAAAERAKADANALIRTLQQPGYALDLERLVYVPVPPAATAPVTPTPAPPR